MSTAHRTAPARRTRARREAAGSGRSGWAIPVLTAAAAGLIGLAFVPDGGVTTAVAVDAAAAAAPSAAPAPPSGSSVANGAMANGAIVIPAPAVQPPPAFVVPHPVVVPGAIVPPYVPYGVPARTSPPPARCGGYSTPRRVTPSVAAGIGSATVSFPADLSTAVRSYRVEAVSQALVGGQQPPHVVGTAAQVSTCSGQLSVVLTGLTSGAPYVFWLEEETADPHYPVTRFVQVGSSQPVVIG